MLVMPDRLACATAAFSAARWSSSVALGITCEIKSAADSFKWPVGSPLLSRTIRPFTGSFVAFVIPASSRTFELTQTLCPS
jgi:hypothetical protein